MKLSYPLKNPRITQLFGENLNSYYKERGLLGHSGIDMSTFFGDKVYAPCAGIVSATINKNDTDPMKYRGVSIIVEDEGNVCYEVQCGHLDHINVTEGDIVPLGAFIGTEGNSGDVASNGVKITYEMKVAGSTAGTHLHFNVRLLKKVLKTDRESKKQYSRNSFQSTYVRDGYIYEIPLWNNGFWGSIDPQPFLTNEVKPLPIPKELITDTLRYGSKGTQVKLLQKKLGLKQDGIFGTMTDKSVRDFQKAGGLKVDGWVGVETRKYLNQI